jgi:hypothetical protein
MDAKKLKALGQYHPYCLVMSKMGKYQAVYNRKYELIAENASAQLVAFALEHHTQRQQGFTFTEELQQPYWMTESLAPECWVYHLYSDLTSIADRERIPDR